MTESEWAACGDPGAMLRHLGRRASARKLRLFAVACCRRLLHVADGAVVSPERGEDYHRAVETSERYADGLATAQELGRAAEGADDSAFINSDVGYEAFDRGIDPFRDVAEEHLGPIWEELLAIAAAYGTGRDGGEPAERAAQVGLLRDLFGDPFRPAALTPAQLSPTVVALARSAYDELHLPGGELESDRLAVLADALEEAGAIGEILDHLRSPGPHVRGCWPVDLCLGLS